MDDTVSSYETRLIRIQSQDKNNVDDPNTHFSVTYGNEAIQYADRVVGLSVDSVTSPNFIPNVPLGMSMPIVVTGSSNLPDGTYNLSILGGILTLEEFALQLNNSFYALFGAQVIQFVTPFEEDPSPETLFANLQIRVYGDDGGVFTVAIQANPDNLSWYFGIAGRPTVWTSGPEPGVYEKYYTRTNLNGLPQSYVHSQVLTAGRLGIDSRGPSHDHSSAFSCIAAVPMTVPYGFYQQWDNSSSSAVRPAITYGGPISLDMTTIDISLRDGDNDVIDLGLGEMTVILRLWLKNT